MVSYRSTSTLHVCSSSFLRNIRRSLGRTSTPLKALGIQTSSMCIRKRTCCPDIIERGIVETSTVRGHISRSQGTVRSIVC